MNCRNMLSIQSLTGEELVSEPLRVKILSRLMREYRRSVELQKAVMAEKLMQANADAQKAIMEQEAKEKKKQLSKKRKLNTSEHRSPEPRKKEVRYDSSTA